MMNRQDCIQHSYIELTKALPWFHNKLASFDHEDSADMLRKVFVNILCQLILLIFNLAQTRHQLSSW